MISGYDVVPVRKTADLAPSAVTATCEHCGKTIGKTRASSGADLWITEGAGGVLCPNADASISQGHRPKTARSADNYTICGHDECTPAYMAEHGNAESHKIHRDKKFPDGWHPNPHTHEEWKGNPQLEREFKDDKTSSLTVTAKEVGYYVCSRNGVPISGPYATRSDAAPNMIEQRGATVMFIGPGNSAEWDALKAKTFPVGTNTVNGAKIASDVICNQSGCHNKATKIWDTPVKGSQVGFCDEHEGPPTKAQPRTASWDDEDDPWAGQHTAEWATYDTVGGDPVGPKCEACGGTPTRKNDGVNLCSDCDRRYSEHPLTAASDAAALVCMECNKKFKRKVGPGSTPKCPGCGGYDVEPDYQGGFPLHGSMQERYATGQRLATLRHFAEDDEEGPEEDEWFKQPKGLTDQVDTGLAPASEIQDPNPLAGQDLERAPHNLAEAARMYAGLPDARCYTCGKGFDSSNPHTQVGHDGTSYCSEECLDSSPNPEDYPQDTPHDQLDDPWNGQENPLGRGWGDPPLGY